MNWEQWFITFGGEVVSGNNQFGSFVGFTIEDMYQMFKNRLIVEMAQEQDNEG
jgi:hypothetical protein